jgi:hypothetical protein
MPFLGFGKKKQKPQDLYAPIYCPNPPNESARRGQAEHFRPEWDDLKEEIQSGLTADYPPFHLGGGRKATVLDTGDLRFDREYPCKSYGHPADKFHNYAIQANEESSNGYLRNMASSGNGRHRLPPQQDPSQFMTFGGSTISSVNLQQDVPLTPKRVSYALEHSMRTASPVWVLGRETNLETVPGCMRDRQALYPYEGWEDRQNPRNPYSASNDDGTLTEGQQYYIEGLGWCQYVNGQYIPI